MTETDKIVLIVDDDEAIRRYMGRLLDQVGLDHRGYASAEEFLSEVATTRAGARLLAVRIPGEVGRHLHDGPARVGLWPRARFGAAHGRV